jgi:cupin superfamily acireductone dioxygenase involved in methionine salvage
VAEEQGYKNRDMINVSKEGFGEVHSLSRWMPHLC